MDRKSAISVQFLLLLPSFVTSGKSPHFSGNEIVGPGQSEQPYSSNSILAPMVNGHQSLIPTLSTTSNSILAPMVDIDH